MSGWLTRIENLDATLFDGVPSQTEDGDRRSLVAVQRATARKHGQYSYLEIGSYLGGSIQTHLVDDRCTRIYSIDPRPPEPPDDRSPGYTVHYANNTSERMLNLLRGIGYGDVGKIECFESDAAEVDPNWISSRPDIVLIDGEHTSAAVLSDFQFCCKIVSEKGTILFHDFGIIQAALREICSRLKQKRHVHVPLKLDGEVFGIFLDPQLIHEDPHLAFFYRKARRAPVREWLKRLLPAPVVTLVKRVRRALRETAKRRAGAAG